MIVTSDYDIALHTRQRHLEIIFFLDKYLTLAYLVGSILKIF